MACFLVSVAEAAAVTAIKKSEEKKEKKKVEAGEEVVKAGHILIEHIWHGEVVPWFPFLTAMESKEETLEMLKEMATVGFSMAGLVTAVWVVMLLVSASIEKKTDRAVAEKQ